LMITKRKHRFLFHTQRSICHSYNEIEYINTGICIDYWSGKKNNTICDILLKKNKRQNIS